MNVMINKAKLKNMTYNAQGHIIITQHVVLVILSVGLTNP